MLIHASDFGWVDANDFCYCGAFGPGMEKVVCFLVSIDGRPRTTEVCDVATPKVQRTTWRFGDAVRFSWEIQEGEYLENGPPHRGPHVLLKGTLKGEQTAQVLDRLSVAGENPEAHIHLDAIEVSPDGGAIAVLIHSHSGEWTDEYHPKIWSTNDLAGRLWNASGL